MPKKLKTIGIGFIIISFMLISLYVSYKIEINKKPVIKEKINSGDYRYLYSFYIDPEPNVENKQYFGNPEAPIDMIAYLDITSDASKYFLSEIFPEIKHNYIDTGLVKFYSKNHITIRDFNEKNEKFIYTKSLLCIDSINRDVYYQFYFDLFSINSADEIKLLFKKYNISEKEYKECMQNKEFMQLKEDISEIENFGLQGINARFYIGINGTNYNMLDGIPKYRKFNRTIREYEFIIGN